jgi:hypothetical protein
MFPPWYDFAPIFGLAESAIRVLRGVVVDGGYGHFWSYIGSGDRWFELDELSREEVSFEDVVAPHVLRGVVRLFYVEPRPEDGATDDHWSSVAHPRRRFAGV